METHFFSHAVIPCDCLDKFLKLSWQTFKKWIAIAFFLRIRVSVWTKVDFRTQLALCHDVKLMVSWITKRGTPLLSLDCKVLKYHCYWSYTSLSHNTNTLCWNFGFSVALLGCNLIALLRWDVAKGITLLFSCSCSHLSNCPGEQQRPNG